jgi:hypothetical protein
MHCVELLCGLSGLMGSRLVCGMVEGERGLAVSD